MNKLYDDPEFRDKVEKTQNDILEIKGQYYKFDEYRKKLKVEQGIIINNMTKISLAKRRLMEQKI